MVHRWSKILQDKFIGQDSPGSVACAEGRKRTYRGRKAELLDYGRAHGDDQPAFGIRA